MTLSVIVPVYNVEKYLDECVQSIVNQTFTDFEVILVDDGSTDSSGRMCDEWVTKDNRIKVIHQHNQGLSGARNTGISAAKGKYISFVDSDDLITENMFEVLIGHMENENLDAVWGTFYRFFNDDINNRNRRNIENLTCLSHKEIMNKMVMQIIVSDNPALDVPGTMCASIYRKSIITENNLIVTPVKETSSEDNHFNVRYLDKCNRVKWVNEPLYLYRRNTASLSNNIKDYTVPSFKNFEIQLLEMGKNWKVDQKELALRCKKRTLISFSVTVKTVIENNSFRDAKNIIRKYISDNDIDTAFTFSELKNTQLQVILLWVLLELKAYFLLYILVKIYNRFITR